MPESTKSIESGTSPGFDDPKQTIIDVWVAAVDGSLSAEAGMALLAADEQARARRLRFARDRACFVNRRIFLREVLARYLDCDPSSLRFVASANGRPELVGHHRVSFNASHSPTTAVVAVTYGQSVGVDVERLRHVSDALDVAENTFTLNELESLRLSPESMRSATFLQLWTRKEAVLKAAGIGLRTPLSELDVSCIDDTGIGHTAGSTDVSPHVYTDLLHISRHVGAIAIAGEHVHPVVRVMEVV